MGSSTFLRILFITILIIKVDCLKTVAATVTVSKCCSSGENARIINENEIACDKGLDTIPLIYSPIKQEYLKQIPSNWKSWFSHIPLCSNASRVILKSGAVQTFVLFESGNLLLVDNDKQILPSKYCYDSNIVVYCAKREAKSELSQSNNVKVKKCCGDSAVYSETKKSCIVMNVTDYKINVNDNMKLIDGFPSCESDYVIAGKLTEGELKEDGSLHIAQSVLPPLAYCLEHLFENATQSAGIITCHTHLRGSSTTPSVVAGPGVTVSTGDLRLKLYPAGLLLSAVFLAATLAAGTVLPATHHHVLHWRCQTNHVACLLLGDVLLAITQLAGDGIGGRGLCVTIAISMHFLFLAAFFWLNTMCFNIWWTFRDLRPGTLEKRQERCRLRLYGVYAWGGPFIIAMIALILDTLPRNAGYTFLRPKFGEDTCWFPGDMEILAYFFGPVGFLLIINLLLFAATARELTCGLWKRELVKSTTERAALGRVCMKLVVVMGVTWIADVLSWAVGGPQALWYITDLINALQGVFIFIVVACQPQVWTAIKRLWCKRQSLAADITGNGNHHSSSSHGLPSYGESVTNHSVSNTTRSVPLETSC